MDNKITHEGELNLNGLIIPCYVLENGERVLSTIGMQRALGIVDNSAHNASSGRLDSILSSKAVSRFISEDNDSAKYSPITCYQGNKKISAYKASILPEICEIMLKVRDYSRENGLELGNRQNTAILQADILIRALARIGIIALVDEATGYQYAREKDELQKILSAYIATELLPWQKRFPDEFYKEIFRLNGWDYTVNGIQNRPGVIGTWTKQLIYNLLPNGVLEELQAQTPKSAAGNKTARLHQSLTIDIGEPHLEKQLISVITLMNISDTWNEFLKNFGRKFKKELLELPPTIFKKGSRKNISAKKYLEINGDLFGQTDLFGNHIGLEAKENIELPKSEQLSDFNSKLNTALNYNPKNNK